jgi:hypothetical protein
LLFICSTFFLFFSIVYFLLLKTSSFIVFSLQSVLPFSSSSSSSSFFFPSSMCHSSAPHFSSMSSCFLVYIPYFEKKKETYDIILLSLFVCLFVCPSVSFHALCISLIFRLTMFMKSPCCLSEFPPNFC